LIGILWILFYDILKKYNQLPVKSFKNFLKNNLWTLIIFIFSIIWIFSFQVVSNLAQWRRGPHVKGWLETKRQAILFPTDKSLEFLLWDKENSLKAINTLKKYKLSVFRENSSNKIIKLSGWNSDGWIGKNATVRVISGQKGTLLMNVYVPINIFSDIYKNSLVLQIIDDEKVINEQKFSVNYFDKGPINIIFNIPKNTALNLEIRLDKSYIPVNYGLGKDLRELGILIKSFDVK
jgi:hypothetical protein